MTKRVPFTKEFEHEAVRLAETSGRTRREVAEDLGVGLSTLWTCPVLFPPLYLVSAVICSN
ncbi:hypothetical protein [Ochrobactrum sp. SFR4]|uniref:hypothetical protein n=1 Tax=Ochrobactrum sp. SFR4 TaxID=2717368 RepID=UPI001C8BD3D2|nr:hypothetical protein [Ochrobactrum sp. SFR4]MBX8828612.1 hypothetical protein [Ochrobactrum sp. SFR4]